MHFDGRTRFAYVFALCTNAFTQKLPLRKFNPNRSAASIIYVYAYCIHASPQTLSARVLCAFCLGDPADWVLSSDANATAAAAAQTRAYACVHIECTDDDDGNDGDDK